MEIDDVWPLFALSLRTPRLELRPMRDEDLPGLVDAAIAGVHDPARMPFGVPWTDADPAILGQSFSTYHWGVRSRFQVDDWAVAFTVLRDGRPIGMQDLAATRLMSRRTVSTGSWLTSSAHGAGLGTEMRAGLLMFAFDHLEAEWAESSAMAWNAASLAVSRRLGYQQNGVSRVESRPGEVEDEVRVRLRVDDFVRPSWALEVDGGDKALAQLGVTRS